MDSQGLLLCSRYSAAPNYFGYCGPPKNSTLIDHLKEKVGDREVETILSQFDSLYLNLNLIAFENKIKDPFDKAVVEAYWIGNNLLRNIKNKDYVALLGERFDLEKRIGRQNFGKLRYKFLSNQILPHHSFHVFNIFKRTGHLNTNHTLETMDSCRIGWGQVVKYQISNIKYQTLRIGGQNDMSKIKNIFIKAKKLSIGNGQLTLSKATIKELKIDYKGKSFIKDLKVGDWVSFHWGFVCDFLTEKQIRDLEYYTIKAIELYNI